jgi:NADPH:quinone reductase
MLAVVSTPGESPPVDLRHVEEPVAGPGEALVEVRAFSLNRGELSLLSARPGWRPGQDVAGVVVQAASSGVGPAQGARVVACVEGAGWAERVPALPARMAELPGGLDFSAAAALPVAGLTALRALREAGALLGRRVLVTGAAGGVGHFAVQLAVAGGAEVTAAVRSRGHGNLLERLGAARVVTYDEDFGGPFHAVMESVGGPVLEASVRSLAAGGVAVLYGGASGQAAGISLTSFGGRYGVSIRSFFIYQTGVDTFGEDLAYLAGLVAAGRLRPHLGLQTSWRSIGDALAAMQSRQVDGKVVLRVD